MYKRFEEKPKPSVQELILNNTPIRRTIYTNCTESIASTPKTKHELIRPPSPSQLDEAYKHISTVHKYSGPSWTSIDLIDSVVTPEKPTGQVGKIILSQEIRKYANPFYRSGRPPVKAAMMSPQNVPKSSDKELESTILPSPKTARKDESPKTKTEIHYNPKRQRYSEN